MIDIREAAIKNTLFLVGDKCAQGEKERAKIIIASGNITRATGLDDIRQMLELSGTGVKIVGVVEEGVKGLLGSLGDDAYLGVISAYYAGDFEAPEEEHSCGGILGAADKTNVSLVLTYYKNQESCVNSELDFDAVSMAVEDFQNGGTLTNLGNYDKQGLGGELLSVLSMFDIDVEPSIWAVSAISGSRKRTCLPCRMVASMSLIYTSVLPEEVTP